MTWTRYRCTGLSSMPELLADGMTFTSLDAAVDRMRAFAAAHHDFEPTLICGRDRSGRRRWELTVMRRTDADRHKGKDGEP